MKFCYDIMLNSHLNAPIQSVDWCSTVVFTIPQLTDMLDEGLYFCSPCLCSETVSIFNIQDEVYVQPSIQNNMQMSSICFANYSNDFSFYWRADKGRISGMNIDALV